MSERCVWVVEVRNGPFDEWRIRPERNEPIDGRDLRKLDQLEGWIRFWNREFSPREYRLAKYVRAKGGE